MRRNKSVRYLYARIVYVRKNINSVDSFHFSFVDSTQLANRIDL